jgi:hypothetical protein
MKSETWSFLGEPSGVMKRQLSQERGNEERVPTQRQAPRRSDAGASHFGHMRHYDRSRARFGRRQSPLAHGGGIGGRRARVAPAVSSQRFRSFMPRTQRSSRRRNAYGRVALRKGPMLRKISLVIAVLMVPAMPAPAQLPLQLPMPMPLAEGTPEERAACASDVHKYCAPALPDTMPVLSCLQANRARISLACNRVLVSHGQ